MDIDLQPAKIKAQGKLDVENLRHSHVMKELEFMAKNKIRVYSRYVEKKEARKTNG